MVPNALIHPEVDQMNARDVMNTPVVAASVAASVREVAAYMLLGGFSGLPVIGEDGSVIGIITEIDIIRVLRSGRPLDTTHVSDVMTPDVISVEPSTPVDQVMRILEGEYIQRVPVLDHGRVVGVVSRPDIIRAAVNPQLKRVG
jgi:CBS domain-containing protein